MISGKEAKRTRGADLSEHPAFKAWQRIRSGANEPKRIDVLKKGPRRKKLPRLAVYRLVGVGAGHQDVIAKYCRALTAEKNLVVLEEILPQAGIPTLHCPGVVKEPNQPYSWLFMEDAGEERCSHLVEGHPLLPGKFLGLMHSKAANVGKAWKLAARGESRG